MANRVSVEDAARRMGKSTQFVRLCLQDGSLPIGAANKRPNSKKWSYYISPKKLDEYIGKEDENE